MQPSSRRPRRPAAIDPALASTPFAIRGRRSCVRQRPLRSTPALPAARRQPPRLASTAMPQHRPRAIPDRSRARTPRFPPRRRRAFLRRAGRGRRIADSRAVHLGGTDGADVASPAHAHRGRRQQRRPRVVESYVGLGARPYVHQRRDGGRPRRRRDLRSLQAPAREPAGISRRQHVRCAGTPATFSRTR